LGPLGSDRGAHVSVGHRLFGAPFRAASTIKVSMLAEVLRQVDCGDISLDEEILVEESDVVGGSGIIQDDERPQEYAVHRLAELMMTISDNTATNVLIDRLGGFDDVNALLDSQNLHEMWLGRKMIHPANPALRQEDYIVADEMLSHLEALYHGRFLSPESVDLAFEFMGSTSPGLFAEALPPDVPIARKGGSLSDIRHDVGYLLVPGREVAIVVLTEGPRDTGETTGRQLARGRRGLHHRPCGRRGSR
jgi:beta-lactamase class A